MNRPLSRLDERGFSLLELVIVLTVLSILAIGFGQFLSRSVDGWSWTEAQVDNSAQARLALDRLAREVYAMPSPATSVSTMTATAFAFTDAAGVTRGFNWSGTKGAPLNFVLDGTSHPLVAAVDSVGFTYLDSTGNVATSAPSLWRVVATIITGAGSHRTTYRTGIYVRNR